MSYNVSEAYTDHPIQHHNLIKLSSSGTPVFPYSAHIFLFLKLNYTLFFYYNI